MKKPKTTRDSLIGPTSKGVSDSDTVIVTPTMSDSGKVVKESIRAKVTIDPVLLADTYSQYFPLIFQEESVDLLNCFHDSDDGGCNGVMAPSEIRKKLRSLDDEHRLKTPAKSDKSSDGAVAGKKGEWVQTTKTITDRVSGKEIEVRGPDVIKGGEPRFNKKAVKQLIDLVIQTGAGIPVAQLVNTIKANGFKLTSIDTSPTSIRATGSRPKALEEQRERKKKQQQDADNMEEALKSLKETDKQPELVKS